MTKKSKHPLDEPNLEGVSALFADFTTESAVGEILPLSKIQPNAKQPRKYFEPNKLQQLVDSIKSQGILAPLLVRPIDNGLFELVAGERRYRAALLGGLDEVPVVIRDLSDSEAFELSLIENLQREDLNPVEETEGVLELLARKLDKRKEDIISLLHQTANQGRDSAQNVLRSSEWKVIEQVFALLGRFTPSSFRASRLGILKLPEEVLEALRKGQIEYTKALAIGRVKNELQRQSLLQFAMAQNLSLNQIKERLKQLDNKNAHESPSLKQRFTTLSSKIQKSKVWDNYKKQKQLEKLVADFEVRIQKLLENN